MSAPSQFKSKFKAFQAICRHGRIEYHPVTGTPIGEIKPLIADFAIHGGEYNVIDPETGAMNTFADIRGHFYDLDVDAEQKGWTDDEKEAVRRRLLVLAEKWPEAVQVHSAPKAQIPWPTYDSVHHSKVASLAADLGLVGEALAFERENKARPSVIAELEKAAAAAEPSVEELAAV